MKRIKKLFLLFAVMFSIQTLNAQPWMENVKSENPTFYEIQNAFNDYWKDKPIEKGQGYKPFKRWEWYWEQRVGLDGKFPSSSVNWDEWEKYSKTHPAQTKSIQSANWLFAGPTSSVGGYFGLGRVNCIAFHPTNPNTFWVGTPAGGLWKTIDNGTNWTTNTDNLPVLGISDIAIDPTNANIMYVATGDGDAAPSLTALGATPFGDTKSIGILKSTDGGSTWNQTGLNWNVTSLKLIRRLIINPNNPQILIAAASDGIWRTTNGGTNWTQLQADIYFMDLEFKPTDPTIVYASTYGNSAQIYLSTNSGASWSLVATLPGVVRINLAVSANWPVLVDALCVNTDYGLAGLWYSSNSGASYTQYFYGDCTHNLLNISYNASGCNGQGHYDLAYAINPNNYNDYWIGGVNTWHSVDGGANWSLNNMWISDPTLNPNGTFEVHADKHQIAFHPLNSSYVFECNDGGIYETNNNGTSWYNITNGMGISQIYRIGTSATTANQVICGLQDNSTKEFYNNNWYESDKTGDGTESIIDYSDGNIKYISRCQGNIRKSTDGGVTYNSIVYASPDSTGINEVGNWITPFLMHPTDHNVLIVGKSQVYQTNNGGSNWFQLGTISGMIGKIISMAYAPSDPQTIYIASFTQIFKTTDGGSNWQLIGTNSVNISYIAVDPINPQKLYIAQSGYVNGDKVSMTPDGGLSYVNYSGSLPNVPVNCIVYEKGSNEGLYVGTDLGVYYTNASMTDWVTYNTGLPNVVVTELEIQYNSGSLYAATFGRGLWKSELYNPLAPLSATATANPTTICAGNSVQLGVSATGGNGTYSYDWVSSPYGFTSNIANPTVTPTETTDYFVNVSSSYLSTNSSIQVIVNPYPSTPIISQNGNQLVSDASSGNQWYLDNNIIPGATNQTYDVTTAGSYYVIVTNNGCSSNISNTINSINVEEISFNNNFKVYPNPVNHELFIETLTSNSKLKFEIINSIGQIVYSSFIDKKAVIDISNFAKGLYDLNIYEGENIYTKRFIKE